MKLELTDEECELVFKAIQELPFRQAAPMVQKIQKQFEEAHANLEEAHAKEEKQKVDKK